MREESVQATLFDYIKEKEEVELNDKTDNISKIGEEQEKKLYDIATKLDEVAYAKNLKEKRLNREL